MNDLIWKMKLNRFEIKFEESGLSSYCKGSPKEDIYENEIFEIYCTFRVNCGFLMWIMINLSIEKSKSKMILRCKNDILIFSIEKDIIKSKKTQKISMKV